MQINANKIKEKIEKSVLCIFFSAFFNISYVLGATDKIHQHITSHIILTIDPFAICKNTQWDNAGQKRHQTGVCNIDW